MKTPYEMCKSKGTLIHTGTPRCTPGICCDPVTFSTDGKAVSEGQTRWALGNTLNNEGKTKQKCRPWHCKPLSVQPNPQGMCSVQAQKSPEINSDTPQSCSESSSEAVNSSTPTLAHHTRELLTGSHCHCVTAASPPSAECPKAHSVTYTDPNTATWGTRKASLGANRAPAAAAVT